MSSFYSRCECRMATMASRGFVTVVAVMKMMMGMMMMMGLLFLMICIRLRKGKAWLLLILCTSSGNPDDAVACPSSGNPDDAVACPSSGNPDDAVACPSSVNRPMRQQGGLSQGATCLSHCCCFDCCAGRDIWYSSNTTVQYYCTAVHVHVPVPGMPRNS